ncbi:hypothetical protein ACHAWC_002470, partial [Mediolabrus comicus]
MSLKASTNDNNDNDNQEVETSTSSYTYHYNKITTLIGRTTSTLISLLFFLLLATQRNVIITTLFIGSILNAIAGKILKKILDHDRPFVELYETDELKIKPSDGGMPSSHAMSLSFIGTVLFFAVVPVAAGAVVGVSMMLYSFIALQYRVRVKLHTVEQILVGYTLGLMNAILWLRYAV